MRKRLAFAHEREIPAVTSIFKSIRFLVEGKDIPEAASAPDILAVPWDVEQAIERVFVSPYAPGWYRDVAAQVLERFAPGLLPRLEWSEMKGKPLC